MRLSKRFRIYVIVIHVVLITLLFVYLKSDGKTELETNRQPIVARDTVVEEKDRGTGNVILAHGDDEFKQRAAQVKQELEHGVPKVDVVEEDVVEVEGERIDWHDWRQIEMDKKRTGPGEQGLGVHLSAEDETKKHQLYGSNGFNALASDKISLNRSLPDIRHAQCSKKHYLKKLPVTSIVIPFHNEHWSTLLRGVNSVLYRAPKHLIKEVILVDDASTKEHCKKQLDDYVATHYTNVRIVRLPKREGLIRARLAGAKEAIGDVLLFLDSHIEASVNFLPPLLEPIEIDYRTAVCPFIDIVDNEDFAYRAQDDGARGAFAWNMDYKRLPLLPHDRENPSEPFESPVMAGGLFAISTRWFRELGGYDPGLDIWGGEQYELSFKIWQCGGKMLDAPCSRIGHVYRKFMPFSNPGFGDFLSRNLRRVADVWMDEYKEYVFQRRPGLKSVSAGDISAQLKIRETLKCKPFSWFMKNVLHDLDKFYPAVELPDMASGEIRSATGPVCIDTMMQQDAGRVGLADCILGGKARSGEQQFQFTWHRDIRPRHRNLCFDTSVSTPRAPVTLFPCHGMGGNQLFQYIVEKKQIKHRISNQCLDCDPARKEVYMNPCDAGIPTQQWVIEHFNVTLIEQFNAKPLDA